MFTLPTRRNPGHPSRRSSWLGNSRRHRSGPKKELVWRKAPAVLQRHHQAGDHRLSVERLAQDLGRAQIPDEPHPRRVEKRHDHHVRNEAVGQSLMFVYPAQKHRAAHRMHHPVRQDCKMASTRLAPIAVRIPERDASPAPRPFGSSVRKAWNHLRVHPESDGMKMVLSRIGFGRNLWSARHPCGGIVKRGSYHYSLHFRIAALFSAVLKCAIAPCLG